MQATQVHYTLQDKHKETMFLKLPIQPYCQPEEIDLLICDENEISVQVKAQTWFLPYKMKPFKYMKLENFHS
jgi:hypothetical protein